MDSANPSRKRGGFRYTKPLTLHNKLASEKRGQLCKLFMLLFSAQRTPPCLLQITKPLMPYQQEFLATPCFFLLALAFDVPPQQSGCPLLFLFACWNGIACLLESLVAAGVARCPLLFLLFLLFLVPFGGVAGCPLLFLLFLVPFGVDKQCDANSKTLRLSTKSFGKGVFMGCQKAQGGRWEVAIAVSLETWPSNLGLCI